MKQQTDWMLLYGSLHALMRACTPAHLTVRSRSRPAARLPVCCLPAGRLSACLPDFPSLCLHCACLSPQWRGCDLEDIRKQSAALREDVQVRPVTGGQCCEGGASNADRCIILDTCFDTHFLCCPVYTCFRNIPLLIAPLLWTP